MSGRQVVMLLAVLVMCGCAGGGDGDARAAGGGAELEAPGLESSAAITAELLRSDVTTIASDDFEGRGPGSDGDRRARAYLASRLESAGAEPFFEGSWEQPFTILGITTEAPEIWSFASSAGGSASFTWWEEYVGTLGTQQEAERIDNAEVVFVGYGIEAPEEQWDDFKGVDLRGKVLLMLNDDPHWDPEMFAGERKLYYGRWVYKYESAARQGAAAAIIIHTTPSAGYGWNVVQNGWSGEQFEVPAGDEPRLIFNAWMTEDAARRLTALGGADLDQLVELARSRDFQPVALDLRTSLSLEASLNETETANVGGLFRGGDAELADEVVVVSAHHDHFGHGQPDETGDDIYNGALDNGIAMSQALAIGKAVGSLETPLRRSVLVFFAAAEEQGILGSEYFMRNPGMPLGKFAANINFELGNVWGRTRDVTIFGMGKSTVEDVLAAAAAKQGRTVAAETTVRAGWYYRSDQFNFAKAGVPAVWFKSGNDFIGRPPGWGEEQYAAWIAEKYHRPSDEVEPSWNFEGVLEDTHLAFAVIREVANADEMPTWYPGDEFADERAAALAALED
jgi:Zn-dependent M28 family amino/carboxypeptidase